MGIFGKTKTIYLDNAGNFSYTGKKGLLFSCPKKSKYQSQRLFSKENLTKELTFLKKVKSKTTALSNTGGNYGNFWKNKDNLS